MVKNMWGKKKKRPNPYSIGDTYKPNPYGGSIPYPNPEPWPRPESDKKKIRELQEIIEKMRQKERMREDTVNRGEEPKKFPKSKKKIEGEVVTYSELTEIYEKRGKKDEDLVDECEDMLKLRVICMQCEFMGLVNQFRMSTSRGGGFGTLGMNTKYKDYDTYFSCPKCGSQAVKLHPGSKRVVMGEAL